MPAKLRLLFLLMLCFFCWGNGYAQTYTKGRVLDKETGEGVSFCKIYFQGSTRSTSCDFDGYFKVENDTVLAQSLKFVFYGYDTAFATVLPDSNQQITIQMSPATKTIKTIVLTGSKENPAHRIMRNVVENKEKNNGYNLRAFQHESYSKIEIDIDKMSKKFQERKAVVKIMEELDSNSRLKSDDGNILLPVFFSETHSQFFFNNNPSMIRENILRTKISGVGITDGSFTSQLIGSYFQSYNIYNNWLNIAYRDFVSPITDHWKTYYDYKLEEFIDYVGGKMCYRLSFTPKRPQDLAFSGTMWITHDEYALKQIDLKIGKAANLNFIEKVNITQELEQVQDSGAWLAKKTRIIIDIEEFGKNPGLLAKSYVSNYNFDINKEKPLEFFSSKIVLDENALDKDPTYWVKNRADSLTAQEVSVYGMIDTIKNVPVVKTYTEIANLLISGYKTIGKLDVGPPLNLYAFNNIEGHRFSLGFKTNYDFSKCLFFKANLAYGTKDEAIKYNAKGEVLLIKKSYTKFGAEMYRDIEQFGVYNQFNSNNYLFNAFNRWGTLRQAFYLDKQSVYIETDLAKGVRQTLKFTTKDMNPMFPFRYRESPTSNTLDSLIHVSELIIGYRFGFKESYLFNDFDRITIGTGSKPVIKVYGVFGFNGFLGGMFEYQKFYIDFSHSFRLGILGRLNYTIKGGYTPSTLPFPLLENHLGNRTIFYNNNSFNMMRIFEFVSDRFAVLSLYHDFDGFIGNRIPLIKKLKWRFFATSNILYGSVMPKNQQLSPSFDENGRPLLQFHSLGDVPYAEVGYGISNIFKFVRIDFLHRLNYLNTGAKPFGVKVSAQFSL